MVFLDSVFCISSFIHKVLEQGAGRGGGGAVRDLPVEGRLSCSRPPWLLKRGQAACGRGDV